MSRRTDVILLIFLGLLIVGVEGFVFWYARPEATKPSELKISAGQNDTTQLETKLPTPQTELNFIGWNVESGGSEPSVIAAGLKKFAEFDIVGLSEVSPKAVSQYQAALPAFESFLGSSGNDDRLLLFVRSKRFEILERKELERFEDYRLNDGRHRSPLLVRLRDRATGLELIVINNHLARGNAEMRKAQAIGLREWARQQTTPVIAIGDYNFDFEFATEKGNEAFVEFMRDGIWKWVRPEPLIDSNWADNNKDGKDDYPDSLLDFVFVAGPAKGWNVRCHVETAEGDFPDGAQSSDHRPVVLTVYFP